MTKNDDGNVKHIADDGTSPVGYSIRRVAAMFHMPTSTLRYYEDVGLLTNVERDPAGQRVYRECHINRLRTICCFKHAGMSIGELQRFFSYESDESGHIDEIMGLLNERHEALDEQRRALEEAHAHLLRKLHYYGDIQKAVHKDRPLPDWADYRNAVFKESQVSSSGE
ncbi:MerR family transcriptional regulator [Bifidobacterium callimiconis]|uniref:Transcriptional regulator, MerR family n=1 Tax=Bifidobacterium callimiconis TaxID=2306973 RepID=A0A430F857_9BIFI|nr:MerR family transcriptional regulator [Bifidobacterium callimiconis]MBT1177099.1 MerR family transcriptional regulator [Bifidobacterium callimiconis]RSX49036.1 transcriptional regulator, MerR family [Bifidobacterium callimiconis]